MICLELFPNQFVDAMPVKKKASQANLPILHFFLEPALVTLPPPLPTLTLGHVGVLAESLALFWGRGYVFANIVSRVGRANFVPLRTVVY